MTPLADFNDWNATFIARFTAQRGEPPTHVPLSARRDAFQAGEDPQAFADRVIVAQPLPVGWKIARGCLWTTAFGGVLLILLLAIGTILFPSSSANTEAQAVEAGLANVPPSAPVLPTEVSYEVSAERLARAYKENEVAANGQFAGKLIVVTGVVHSVTDDPPTVELATGADLQMSFNNVLCEFDPTWRRDIAKLGPGRMVRIVGIVKGAYQGFRPRLVRCSFN
jgi:hypothetical protein